MFRQDFLLKIFSHGLRPGLKGRPFGHAMGVNNVARTSFTRLNKRAYIGTFSKAHLKTPFGTANGSELSRKFQVSRYCQSTHDNAISEEEPRNGEEETEETVKEQGRIMVKEVDIETSLRYMKSNSYKLTYGDVPVWVPYRRNFAGHYPPKKTRKMCIRAGKLGTGNPCPLCRDEYLVIHQKNVDLLKQFIDGNTGEVISYQKTGVCQKRHKELLVAVEKAHDEGYLEMRVPVRRYNYHDYCTET